MIYVFGISFAILLGSIIKLGLNFKGLVSTDMFIDAADTALGTNPIRNTSDNFFAGFRKHIGIAIVVILSGLCSLVSGIIWLVQVLAS
jgi:hypothetical protein